MVALVDTHCHLDFESFDADRVAVIERAWAAGVRAIIVPALDLGNIDAILALTERYEGVFAAVGVHPNSTADWSAGWLDAIRRAAEHPRVVAIGEIGLDYYWEKSPLPMQQTAFVQQLALAAELDLPVIIHNRDATDDVLTLLGESALAGRDRAGVMHSFSAGWPAAERALALGFYIGITGPVTFKKADTLRAIAAQVPLDRLLIETDAPFLTPEPYRGRRNEPAYVRHVAEAIASVRNVGYEVLATHTSTNAARLFGLSPVDHHSDPAA